MVQVRSPLVLRAGQGRLDGKTGGDAIALATFSAFGSSGRRIEEEVEKWALVAQTSGTASQRRREAVFGERPARELD